MYTPEYNPVLTVHWAELLCFTQPCHIVLWVSGVWLDGCLKKWTQLCLLHVPSPLWFTSTYKTAPLKRKKKKKKDCSKGVCDLTWVVTAAVLPTSFCISPKHDSGTMQNVGVKSVGGDLLWVWTLMNLVYFFQKKENVNHTHLLYS